MSENYTAYSPILSLLSWNRWPFVWHRPVKGWDLSPLMFLTYYQFHHCKPWTFLETFLFQQWYLCYWYCHRITEIMASWRALDLVVSSTDGCLESPMSLCREGKEKLKPCAEQLGTAPVATQPWSGMPLLLRLSHLLGFHPSLSWAAAQNTQWLHWLALLEALRLISGADWGKNIRPARSKQCLPGRYLPSLEQEMCC